MKLILIVLAVLLLAAGTGPATPASSAGFGSPDIEAIDSYVEREMRISRIPGLALGIIKDGNIVYLQGYGQADRERTVTPQTPFTIGSLSKSFTAVAAMQLVEEGLLDLDSPVNSYLRWFTMQGEYDAAEITVRHLLVQTSGIPTMAGVQAITEKDPGSLEQEVKALGEERLAHPPGEAFLYSNANYQILGLIIDTLTENGYSGHIRNEIFEPLQMNRSFLSVEEGNAAGMAAGHIRKLGFSVPSDVMYLENSLAAGFIISSAEDMCRYLLMHMGDGSYGDTVLLSEKSAAELHRPGSVPDGPGDYAMGWLVQNSGDDTIILHDGSTQGFNAAMAFSPAEQWGVVVLTNASGMIELPAGPISLGIAEFLRGNEPGGNSRLPVLIYLVVLFFIPVMIVLAAISAVRLPARWGRKIKETRPSGFFAVAGRVVFPVLMELSVPFLVFILIPGGAGFPVWNLLALFHPDLVYGLFILAALLLVKALLRIYLYLKLNFLTEPPAG